MQVAILLAISGIITFFIYIYTDYRFGRFSQYSFKKYIEIKWKYFYYVTMKKQKYSSFLKILINSNSISKVQDTIILESLITDYILFNKETGIFSILKDKVNKDFFEKTPYFFLKSKNANSLKTGNFDIVFYDTSFKEKNSLNFKNYQMTKQFWESRFSFPELRN